MLVVLLLLSLLWRPRGPSTANSCFFAWLCFALLCCCTFSHLHIHLASRSSPFFGHFLSSLSCALLRPLVYAQTCAVRFLLPFSVCDLCCFLGFCFFSFVLLAAGSFFGGVFLVPLWLLEVVVCVRACVCGGLLLLLCSLVVSFVVGWWWLGSCVCLS